MGSLIYQIVDTFKRNTIDMIDRDRVKSEKIPTAKYDAQQQELKTGNEGKWNHIIYSYSTYDTYRNRAIVFSKYVKEKFDVKQLNEITPEMVKDYFESRSDLSAWTLHGDRAALVKLENCMKNRNWLQNDESFVPSSEELNIPDRKLEDRIKDGVYSEVELDSIEEMVSEGVAKYIKFVRGTGARIKGASTIEKKDVDFKNGNLVLKEKNGHTRTIPISKEFQNWLKELIKDKDPDEKIMPVMTDKNVTDQINAARKELGIETSGIHRMRATFARNMYNEFRKRGYDPEEAKKAVSEHLGHNRMSVVRYYVPNDLL